MSSILVLDETTEIATTLKSFLPNHISIHFSSSIESAINRGESEQYSLILTSDFLHKIEVSEVLKVFKAKFKNARILVLSETRDPKKIVTLVKSGADQVMSWPQSKKEYEDIIDYTLQSSDCGCLNDFESCDDPILWGVTPTMVKLRSKLKILAQATEPILLTGPTGSGKGRVAEFIHAVSPFRSRKMVIINSAAFVESLADAELFGSKKGAFTGAIDRRGILEEAHDSIIFLDEIGDLSPSLQVKMLRYIEGGEIRPVGSNQVLYVKSRIIAATNKDLRTLVAQGLFREDLFYRLSNFTVQMPSLNEHREDIPLYIEKLCSEFKATSNRKVIFTEGAKQILRDFDYPGNFRQLRTLVKKIAVLSNEEIIDQVCVRDHLD